MSNSHKKVLVETLSNKNIEDEKKLTQMNRNWIEFKLIITDPPSYKGHFDLIKGYLIPFIEKTGIRFWVTNYYDPTSDYILFRVEVNESELKETEDF